MRAASLLCTAFTVAVLAASTSGQGPAEYTNNFKYLSGQSIQPIFEGWSHAPDGSINMHFGYLNRNYVEQPQIPVGADNRIEPGGPDRGQPTFFYNRTHRNQFTVNVPKSWGIRDELVWTVTFNGQTERAVGWLRTEWEIDPVGGAQGGGSTDPDRKNNKPPTLTLDPVTPVKLGQTATLRANVEDDGLPKPRPRGKPAVGQETPPTLQGGTDAPTNVPQIAARETPPGATAAGGGQTRPQGLSVTWLVWRGPAEVGFSPRFAQPKDGRAETTATFSAPGEYVLRAAATDGAATAYSPLNVTVTGTSTQP